MNDRTLRNTSSAALTALCLLLVSCGSATSSGAPGDTATSGDNAASETTIAPATSAPSVSPPASTVTPETTTATTAATTSTTTMPAPAGWFDVGFEATSDKSSHPCCADTWHGAVSPALTAPAQPLADGVYFVGMDWPVDLSQPLQLELFRFEQCALLPDGACEPTFPSGAPYTADQVGVDTSMSRPFDVALDASVRVVVIGSGLTATGDPSPEVQEGTGVELAELAIAVEGAYDTIFAARLAAGEDASAIIADVTANPAGGFEPAGYGGFVFRAPSAPPLLFQGIFPYVGGAPSAGRGTDVLVIPSIDVVGGQVTINVYAGFYS